MLRIDLELLDGEPDGRVSIGRLVLAYVVRALAVGDLRIGGGSLLRPATRPNTNFNVRKARPRRGICARVPESQRRLPFADGGRSASDRVAERTSMRPPPKGDLSRDLSSTVTFVRLPHSTQRYMSSRRVASSGWPRESTQS